LGVSVLRGIDVDAIASAVSKKAAPNCVESPVSNSATPQFPNGLEDSANVGLPDKINEILSKASAGKALSEPDKMILRGWMSRNQSINSGIEQPERVPVPAPGEV
jgi:hypothetical protein